MAFNAEAELKLLRARVEGLERKLDSMEKTLRASPDLAAIAKLGTRLDAAEKAIAGKKDVKTAQQEADKASAKVTAEFQAQIQAQNKDLVNKAMLDGRLRVLEAQVQQALAMAAGKR